MTVDDRSAVSRRFTARAPFWGSKVAAKTTPAYQNSFGKSHLVTVVAIFALTAVLGGMYVGLHLLPGEIAETVAQNLRYILLVVLVGGVGIWYWWQRRRRLLIDVTSDALTVSTRPGDVYSFNEAKLGTWGITGGMTMGSALHLQCGPRRFVLGGQDFRVPAGIPVSAADVGYGLPVDVDARLSASDFEQILDIAGLRDRPDVRRSASGEPPAPAEPARCLLFTNPLLVQEIGVLAFGKRHRFMQSLHQPRLAIDVVPHAIRVVDPNNNALIASASASQVTATPVTYRPPHWQLFTGNAIAHFIFRYLSMSPGLVISVPGMQPLTIGCRDAAGGGLERRFSWPSNVPTERARADYEVSGADWQTLVATFGLTPRLVTRG
jgi:hypothetical protein